MLDFVTTRFVTLRHAFIRSPLTSGVAVLALFGLAAIMPGVGATTCANPFQVQSLLTAPNRLGVLATSSPDRPGALGAVVARVFAGSAADELGILPGDKILSIDGVPVEAKDGNAALAQASKLNRQSAEVVVERDDEDGMRDFTLHVELGGLGQDCSGVK